MKEVYDRLPMMTGTHDIEDDILCCRWMTE